MDHQELILCFTDREKRDFVGMSRWFRGIGFAVLAIGLLAVILPHIATITVQILVAVILILSGILNMAHALTIRKWRSVTWEFLLAILFLLTGILFVVYPMSGAFALTLMLGIFFVILGVFKIQSAMAWRRRPGWIWVLTSGILSIILGIIVLTGLPGTALWTIGLILGIDLVFSGITLIALGSAVKSIASGA